MRRAVLLVLFLCVAGSARADIAFGDDFLVGPPANQSVNVSSPPPASGGGSSSGGSGREGGGVGGGFYRPPNLCTAAPCEPDIVCISGACVAPYTIAIAHIEQAIDTVSVTLDLHDVHTNGTLTIAALITTENGTPVSETTTVEMLLVPNENQSTTISIALAHGTPSGDYILTLTASNGSTPFSLSAPLAYTAEPRAAPGNTLAATQEPAVLPAKKSFRDFAWWIVLLIALGVMLISAGMYIDIASLQHQHKISLLDALRLYCKEQVATVRAAMKSRFFKKHHIRCGSAYFIINQKTFNTLIKDASKYVPVLLFTWSPAQRDMKGASVYWVTQQNAENAINPSEIEETHSRINEFVTKNESSIIAIDCIDYLNEGTNTASVAELLRIVKGELLDCNVFLVTVKNPIHGHQLREQLAAYFDEWR